MNLTQLLSEANSWEQRYRYLIQAGKKLVVPTAEEFAQMQEIEGCESRLWFQWKITDEGIQAKAFSESRIMNGLLYLLLEKLQTMSINELTDLDFSAYLAQYQLAERLSSTRLNGLKQIENLLKTK